MSSNQPYIGTAGGLIPNQQWQCSSCGAVIPAGKREPKVDDFTLWVEQVRWTRIPWIVRKVINSYLEAWYLFTGWERMLFLFFMTLLPPMWFVAKAEKRCQPKWWE